MYIKRGKGVKTKKPGYACLNPKATKFDWCSGTLRLTKVNNIFNQYYISDYRYSHYFCFRKDKGKWKAIWRGKKDLNSLCMFNIIKYTGNQVVIMTSQY